MKISVSENNKIFRPLNVQGFRALQSLITRRTYSPGVFRNNERNSQNFEQADMVGLDFDGGLSIEDAREMFKDYKHIIAPTRNHRIAKKGLTADRFRVILFLSSPITDSRTYSDTVKSLLAKFPQADKACKDAARMFYPSGTIYSSSPRGVLVDPVVGFFDTKITHDHSRTVEIDFSKKPAGWSNCKWALANGHFEQGEGNEAMMTVASTCKKLNMTKEQAYYTCKNALQLREARTGASYDKSALWREVIETVYSDQWRGTMYVCSEKGTWLHDYCQSMGANACGTGPKALNFRPIGKILEGKTKVDWLVDGLFTSGGISLIVGKPKSGKSTIIRQLAKSVARGERFLERDVKQGSVLYLALEEQEEMLNEQFKKLGVTDADPILIHVGGVFGPNALEELTEYAMERRPSLLVIDTLSLFANFKNINDYSEVNDVLAKYRKLARESGAHVAFIHHQNKSDNTGAGSIMGSNALHGAVDIAFIFNNVGDRRFINTSGRGGRAFRNQEVTFNPSTETYELGGIYEPDEF